MDIIKVAIADDHQIFRKGVILSLRQYNNIKFVFEADNGEDLIQKVSDNDPPDVILIDLKMPVKIGRTILAPFHVLLHLTQIRPYVHLPHPPTSL